MPKARQMMMRLYHMGAGALERQTGVDRHDWLADVTGKSSSKDCSDAELARAIDLLKAKGFIQPRKQSSGTQHQLPKKNNQQWKRLTAAARDLGWNGLLDTRTKQFINRTAKPVDGQQLTSRQLSSCISGMERMHKQRLQKAQEAGA